MMTSRHKQIMRTFAKRLKEARELAGYKSAASFAAALALEPHTYRKYERGDAEPNLETLTRMCHLLRVTPNHLLPLAAQVGDDTPATRHSSPQPDKENRQPAR